MDEFSAKNILAKVAERGRREAINEVKVLHYDKLVEENAKLKESNDSLKDNTDRLQRDYSHLLRQKQDCETGKHNLHSIIEKIEAKAYIWDGHESMHYGNAIMKIIHPTWGDAQ